METDAELSLAARDESLALAEKARSPKSSIQIRVTDPEKLAGGWSSGMTDFMGFLAGQNTACPPWSSPLRRADYLETIWRNDSRLSGVIFTMVSRMASLGWAIVGPVKKLKRWYDMFSWADEEGWTQFIKLLFTDYLTTDEGGILETTRDFYPRGSLRYLWNMDARHCIPGPVTLPVKGDKGGRMKAWPLIFKDQDNWKGLKRGQFYRIASLPTTDQFRRRMGFCFMSRVLRYAALADATLTFQEERVSNLPPDGIATISGLTRPQVEKAMQEYTLQRKQKNQLTWPGILWLVSNTYGQECKVAFTSFREVWEAFSDREMQEIFCKVVALDAGMDVSEIWQVEFHGATKAASWLQHKKSLGKGSAEFIVEFERWVNRNTPADIAFRFDTPDDEQDLMHERIRQLKIKNVKELWLPDPTGERLLNTEQALEMLSTEQVIPNYLTAPSVRTVTDIAKARSGMTVGRMHFPSGQIVYERPYWQLDSTMLTATDLDLEPVVKQEPDIDELLDGLPSELVTQLIPIVKRWESINEQLRRILDQWQRDIVNTLETDPDALSEDGYWSSWGDQISDALMPEFYQSALEGGMSVLSQPGLDVSFDRVNQVARTVAEETMFDMVKLDGEESIVRSRRDLLNQVRQDLAEEKIAWTDVEGRLTPYFGASRARMIAVSENTDLWAKAQLNTAKGAGLTMKQSVRADIGRVCPTNICNDAQAAGWVGIDEEIVPGYTKPRYHPFCYCLLHFDT